MADNSKIIEKIIQKNKLTASSDPARYTSGIIHDVYDLGDYVLKVEGEARYAKGTVGHQREILDKLASIGAKVPNEGYLSN